VRYDDIDIDLSTVSSRRGRAAGLRARTTSSYGSGNYIAYSLALFESGDRYGALRARWLPFYDDELRAQRLESVRISCLNNLDHVSWSLARGDRFHAFSRIYHAFQEFLQALFISSRTCPLA